MSGRWEGPDDVDALLNILHKIDPGDILIDPGHFVRTMRASGLILRAAYYVPDERELINLMRHMHFQLRETRGFRWVMCRETIDALAAKYRDTRVPAPPKFSPDFWLNEGADLPTAALQMEVETLIESRRYWSSQDKLFGIPIRVDPAARRPMFEIDAEEPR